MIDLTIHPEALERNVEVARKNHIILPTFEQMKHPELIPDKVKEALKNVGLWDVNPLNLFRITWHNEPVMNGGQFGGVNYIELPSSLTGVKARIFCLIGKWFPTGCHKVGASYGCLVPRLVTGQFDATYNKAVWPSTGNYCRGGAFNSKLLACESVAILPAEMSKERFDWLSKIAGEVIATPGCESNVKEIFDKTWELRRTRDDVVIFNQFEEMGNCIWHYQVTGNAIAEVFETIKGEGDRLAGACFTSGSAGTMSAGDLLKEKYPHLKLAVGEALQCPTLLENGFGGHRIEGIGDKHPRTCCASSTARRARSTWWRRPASPPRLWKSCPSWASPASPTCFAASRWPSTTSSPSTTSWPPSAPTPPSCTRAASRSWTSSRAPTPSWPLPTTSPSTCRASAPTPCWSSPTRIASGSTT